MLAAAHGRYPGRAGQPDRARPGHRERGREHEAVAAPPGRENWRMPRLAMLAPAPMSAGRRVAMVAMWIYVVIAMAAVVVKVVLLATGH